MTRNTFRAELAQITRELAKAASGGSMIKASSPAVMSGETFLAKATYAATAGRISSAELTELEFDIARRHQPRADLVKAVVGVAAGAGRITVDGLSAAEAGSLVNAQEFLAKAMDLQKQGKLAGRDISEIEISLNAGQRPSARLARAVESGQEPDYWRP